MKQNNRFYLFFIFIIYDIIITCGKIWKNEKILSLEQALPLMGVTTKDLNEIGLNSFDELYDFNIGNTCATIKDNNIILNRIDDYFYCCTKSAQQ